MQVKTQASDLNHVFKSCPHHILNEQILFCVLDLWSVKSNNKKHFGGFVWGQKELKYIKFSEQCRACNKCMVNDR